jgi:hypothetical protein
VARGLGLGDAERCHEVANAQLPVRKEQAQDFEPSLVSEQLEELGNLSQMAPP